MEGSQVAVVAVDFQVVVGLLPEVGVAEEDEEGAEVGGEVSNKMILSFIGLSYCAHVESLNYYYLVGEYHLVIPVSCR